MRLFSVFSDTGLKGKSLRSSFLTLFNFGSQNLIRLGGNLILTRLLFPEAFGLMALVQVVMMGLNMFSDIGLRVSIIQNERGDDPRYLNSAWVLQIARGLVLWLVTCALAVPLAAFYEAPLLAQMLPVVGLTAIIQGFNSTKLATANRHLALGRVTMIEIGARTVGLMIVIGLALWLETVWALVIGGLAAPLFIMIFSHSSLPGPGNRFQIDTASARQLVEFGKYIFISTVAGFLIVQGDRAVLGKFITLSDLALYNIAFFLATLPQMIMQRLSDSVLFPLYSRMARDEDNDQYDKLAKARMLIVGSALVFSLILALCGNWLIILLYDPRYEAAGPLLVLMALSPLSWFVSGGYSMMILARGHSDRFAAQVVIAATIRTGFLIWLVVQYGILGAILAPFISGILVYPITVWFIHPYASWLPRQDLFFAIAGALIVALVGWVNQDVIWGADILFGTR